MYLLKCIKSILYDHSQSLLVVGVVVLKCKVITFFVNPFTSQIVLIPTNNKKALRIKAFKTQTSMKRNSTVVKSLVLGLISLMSVYSTSFGAVTVGAATGGACLNVTPGSYTQLSWITIKEVAAGDIPTPQTGATIVLTAPAGFEFNPGVGTLQITGGGDIINKSLTVTSSTITVGFDVTGTSVVNNIRIKFIEVRALASNISGDVVRTGGTAVITGDATGSGISHANLIATGSGAIITSAADGDWTNPATWTGGLIPSCSDIAQISHKVVVNNTASVNNVSILSGGELTSDRDLTISNTFTIANGGTYIHNNNKDVVSTIFAGTETFNSGSTIQINDWYDNNRPLAEFVTGDFGNIIFNNPGSWNNSGMFAPSKIKGNIEIASGTVVMDEGSGMTTALTLQDVSITGGVLIMQKGADRNLTLVTGNFTQSSTLNAPSRIMDNSMGNLVWTVNGNLNIAQNFTILEGAGLADVGDIQMTVNGNMNFTNGAFKGVRKAVSDMDLTVTGNINISGTPTSVYMIQDYSGDLNLTTTDLIISAGDKNNFMGGDGGLPTGDATFNITRDLQLTGATTKSYFYLNSGSTGLVDISVGRDMTVTNSELNLANNRGDVSVTVGRNIEVTGSSASLYGQRYDSSPGNVVVTANGHLHLTSGIYTQQKGRGSAVLTVTEEIYQAGGTFFVINNNVVSNNGTVNLSMSDLDFNGGLFNAHKGFVTDGRQVVVDISNNALVNFSSTTDELIFIRKAGTNNAALLFNVGGNVVVNGTANGLFASTYGSGIETINVVGNFVVNAGRVRFNGLEDGTGKYHDVMATIQGSLEVNGGSLGLSANSGTSTWTIQGEYIQTGGLVFHKNKNGLSNVTVNLNYTQTGGTVDFHLAGTDVALFPVNLTINGNATFANTTLSFDASTVSTAEHNIFINGSSFTLGNNALITHANNASSRTVFGNIYFQSGATTTYNRTSTTSSIRQVRQTINAGTTLDVRGSVSDMIIASHLSSTPAVYNLLVVNGIVNLGLNRIFPFQQPGYYSGVTVSGTGVLMTAHANGLYDAAALNSAVYPTISGSLRMDYSLASGSKVIYNGVDNQQVTGINQGIATGINHRYSRLEIDFQGTANTEWVYPMDDNVYVRNDLRLTNGEFNLDSDHDATNGGRLLHIETGATITRVNGYLRSETIDGTAAIDWSIATTGSFIVPFGYNSGLYLPFTYQPVLGVSGNVTLATYHSNNDNTPYPPTVTHTNDLLGADNSGNTVDRYWRVEVPGSVTANLQFTYAPAEAIGISSPRAQRWEPVSMGWELPLGIQTNPTATSTAASGLTGLGSWWTLSSSSNPLPIQLLSFDAFVDNDHVKLIWTTASEINNFFFTVMRSGDGENFHDLFNVGGSGTTTSVTNYSAIDPRPLFGTSYYRLKQTDYNGKESLSSIKKVTFLKSVPVSVFPNPLRNGVLTVSTGNVDDRIINITVMDMTGKSVISRDYSSDGYKQASVGFVMDESLPTGTYMMIINSESGIHRERLVKQ